MRIIYHSPCAIVVLHQVQRPGDVAVAVVTEKVVDPPTVDVRRLRDAGVPPCSAVRRLGRVQLPHLCWPAWDRNIAISK